MTRLVPRGTIVAFQPQGPWKWEGGFDGCLPVGASFDRIDLEGNRGAVDLDLQQLASQLVGKPYAADGHDDTPGVVLQAKIAIDHGTLCDRVILEGRLAAKADTTGTFRIDCAPSLKAGAPPVPDPLLAHLGIWRIRQVNPTRTCC
jgi:hypothetical protein